MDRFSGFLPFIRKEKEQPLQREYETSGGIHVVFDWTEKPYEWAGLSANQLVELVQEIADYNKIKTEDQKKIHVRFVDNEPYVFLNGIKYWTVAFYSPTWEEDILVRSDIHLSRSLEVMLTQYSMSLEEWKNHISIPDENDFRIEDNLIVATLRQREEAVIWMIGEEINHAAVNHKLKTNEKLHRTLQRYASRMAQIFRPSSSLEEKARPKSYSENIVEVTASRQVLRFLIARYQDKQPERAAFFQKMLDLSYEKQMAVIPRTAFVSKEIYSINKKTSPKQ